MQIYTISTADRGQRLDKYIRRILPGAPSSVIYKNLRQKNITLNGKKALGSEIVAMGDEVRLYLSDETIGKFGGVIHGAPREIPRERSGAIRGGMPDHDIERVLNARQAARVLRRQYPQLRMVYEDRDIAAAYKPAGLLSQKAKPDDLSLNEWFLGTLLERGEVTEESLRMFTPSAQNRLDRGTQGLVLLSKTLQGSHLLTGLQRERTLQKYYSMIVCGRLDRAGEVEGWLLKDSASNTVTLYEEERPGAVYSKTQYRPYALSSDGTLTGVEARLITGRTHQLRAHMASLGHPILGDPKYGDPAFNQAYRRQGVTSQLLICHRVVFPALEGDYASLSGMTIETPLPEICRTLLRHNNVRPAG